MTEGRLEKNISTLIIDDQSYFFKLSEKQDFSYLKRLAEVVEKKIISNKQKFDLKDYQKLLILTSLNLAEDIVKLRKQMEELKQGDNEPNETSSLEIIERLENLRDALEEVGGKE